ncbi:MAG: oligoendopeptidase F [Candidatus Liberibacter europaeus]|uniref:Oligoendopeptidase F n=1 Tax=Candidatus Liberibacter europaeus TaxID=744859 RepID=A0A2T4VXA3_9HYPH|nr:oligoendopeptidase F [Candidatus Liberibacter europaeus]PTL86404.1 MAG: oligoendopeptidase F [Candidatus Liberibacter europaeus]
MYKMIINIYRKSLVHNSLSNESISLNNVNNLKENLGNLPRWNLQDLYKSHDSQEILNDLERIDHESLAFRTRWKDNVADATTKTDCSGLGAAISEYERLADLMGRIFSYVGLLHSCHLSDPIISKFYIDTTTKLTNWSNRLIFFTLEINHLDDKLIEKSYTHDFIALKYSPWIKNIRKFKKHLLSDDLECLLSDTSQTGGDALKRFFAETLESLRFTVKDQKLSLEKTLNFLINPDRKIREESGKAIFKTLNKSGYIFSFITNTLAKEEEIQDRWRKYENIADSRHLANDIESSVIESLTKSVKDNYPNISHRYYAIKKKLLKLDKMKFWDRSAPLPETPDSVINFKKAQDITLAAYSKFSPQMSDIAEKFFTNNWIDAAQYEGKGSGAFSHGTVPSAHPYISLNYAGKLRDVMTLAHELGHGIHQVLSAKNQGLLMADSSLTLAETASIFGETLTFDSLMSEISDKKERKILLANRIEDSINSIIRQISFYDFEIKLHTERRSTGELTIKRINEIWLETQKEAIGPDFDLDNSGYDNFWMVISHFINSSFYVYSYAFGHCLVNSLYEIYKSNTVDQFQEKYLDILRAGNSKHHSELLQPFDINLSDPGFWNKGLRSVEKMIDELENM